jgi:predicted HicB family RNase H-like nuclease
METGAERVSDDLNAVQEEAHIDPEDQDRVIDVAPEKVTEKKQPSGSVSKVMQNLAVAKKEFHDEYLAACQSMGIEPDTDMTEEQATKVMKEINLTLDKAA